MGSLTRTLALAVVGVGVIAGTALADTSGKKIAFSNNYAGNSWRQAMLEELRHRHQEGGRRQGGRPPPTSSPPPTRKCRPRRPRSRT